MLPSTQGVPVPIDSVHVALLLLSILSGLPPHSSAALVAEYAGLRPTSGGETLVETLAGFLDKPHDFFELRVDAFAQAAVLSYRAEDHGMQVASFHTHSHQPRPAFERVSILGASTLTELSQAIAATEPPRLGRRRTIDRYQRLERAVRF
ncbi:hypothetical protein C9427_21445 [Mesorhizobium helmanticense]|uniref:Uncharacterized protein n=2 Tax=Mesorhizobium helmanticense TaxID=1776423 RepID=A0A2T4IRI7_9HYPH|nr:hypothetical protein C9427_21445 [Mesorhizobium helmanticense]